MARAASKVVGHSAPACRSRSSSATPTSPTRRSPQHTIRVGGQGESAPGRSADSVRDRLGNQDVHRGNAREADRRRPLHSRRSRPGLRADVTFPTMDDTPSRSGISSPPVGLTDDPGNLNAGCPGGGDTGARTRRRSTNHPAVGGAGASGCAGERTGIGVDLLGLRFRNPGHPDGRCVRTGSRRAPLRRRGPARAHRPTRHDRDRHRKPHPGPGRALRERQPDRPLEQHRCAGRRRRSDQHGGGHGEVGGGHPRLRGRAAGSGSAVDARSDPGRGATKMPNMQMGMAWQLFPRRTGSTARTRSRTVAPRE